MFSSRQVFRRRLSSLQLSQHNDGNSDDANANGRDREESDEQETITFERQNVTTEEDDDDVTIIGVEDLPNPPLSTHLQISIQQLVDADQESQRRSIIQNEIEREQRTNFCHFALLCLVPTSLLLIVIITVLGEGDTCVNTNPFTNCFQERRSFVNAFTSRCVCDAVLVES